MPRMTDAFPQSWRELESAYEILDQLGRGTFAKVYKARRRNDGQVFGVKVVDKSNLDDETKDLLQNELETLRIVSRHRGIVTLYESYECEDRICFVMEYINGGPLLDRIVEKGHFSENDARVTMKSTLRSLAFLAELGVVHRDIKPENILVDEGSSAWPTRLTDFGLSAKLQKNELLYAKCGTPAFCSPEVLSHTGYDCACDVWSFGVVLYIILSGYPPFYRESQNETLAAILGGVFTFPEAEWSHVSEDAKDLLRKMLVVDPKKRISAAEALRHPWFTAKQSTTNLQNKALVEFNRRRTLRAAVIAIQGARTFLMSITRNKKNARSPSELNQEVERYREVIRRFEANQALLIADSAKEQDSNGGEASRGEQEHAQPLRQPCLRRRRKSLILPTVDLSSSSISSSEQITNDENSVRRRIVRKPPVKQRAETLLSRMQYGREDLDRSPFLSPGSKSSDRSSLESIEITDEALKLMENNAFAEKKMSATKPLPTKPTDSEDQKASAEEHKPSRRKRKRPFLKRLNLAQLSRR